MASGDMFNFDSPDLVNLQKWAKRLPREFGKAVSGVANTMAFQARAEAVQNIKNATTTRSAQFPSRSMRVEKSRPRTNLNQIVAEMGSIDISRQGRSSGFLELEDGTQSRTRRVPTIAARGSGNRQKRVSPGVRMRNLGKFHRHKAFATRSTRTKQAQVATMLRMIRTRKVENKPLIIPAGLFGRMGGMPPGVYKMRGRSIRLMNPFDGKRGKTKGIRWMQRATLAVSSRRRLLAIWKKEIDFRLSRR